MKKLKSETLIGIILIIILGFYGSGIAERIAAARRPQDRAHILAAANQRFVFRSESGVDISGKIISPFFPAGTKTVTVFMLRGASIEADLEFWRRVANLIPKSSAIRLIGYCDGDKCTEAIRDKLPLPEFPVIAYGEIGASQALLNEDAKGDCLLLSGQKSLPTGKTYDIKYVSWRTPGRTPSDVTGAISR